MVTVAGLKNLLSSEKNEIKFIFKKCTLNENQSKSNKKDRGNFNKFKVWRGIL